MPSLEIIFGSVSSMRAHPQCQLSARDTFSGMFFDLTKDSMVVYLLLAVIIGLDLMWDSWQFDV